MYNKKIFEVSEDYERVYFNFFIEKENKIIAVPKQDCKNKAIYAGKQFDNLVLVDSQNAHILLTDLMRRSILTHPILKFCNPESIKLIG